MIPCQLRGVTGRDFSDKSEKGDYPENANETAFPLLWDSWAYIMRLVHRGSQSLRCLHCTGNYTHCVHRQCSLLSYFLAATCTTWYCFRP